MDKIYLYTQTNLARLLLGLSLAGLLIFAGTTVNAEPSAANPPATLLLTSAALVVPMNGGTSQLTTRVRDAAGQPVAGVVVQFTSQQGTLTPVGAITDAQGLATTQFTAGDSVGQAVISAQVATLSQQAAIQIIKPDGAATGHSLTLTLARNVLDPGQQITVNAQLRDGAGAPVRGELISFFGALGSVTPASASSDANGTVSFTYRAGNRAGQALLTALAGYATATTTVQIKGAANNPNGDYHIYLPAITR